MIRRREFIAGLGMAMLPHRASAQQDGRVRRLGVLDYLVEGEPASQTFMATIRQGLAKLGWVEGLNLRIDIRHNAVAPDQIRAMAAELVALEPHVIVANSGATIRALQQQTRSIPIAFAGGGDVALNGIVKNIAQPEGNATGIANLFYSIGGKWLELLKEAVPSLEKAAVIYDGRLIPAGPDYGYPAAIEAAARVLGVQIERIASHEALALVRAVDRFAAEPNGGLIIIPPLPSPEGRGLINQLAAQHRLPTIYGGTRLAGEGGLISYATKIKDLAARLPFYIDRLFRGAKVSELPVEYPTKFEMVVNLKTAKALGLTVPQSILLRADEVIE
jgi:putative tryptophan/tyrosine transport system substrate-binding protein